MIVVLRILQVGNANFGYVMAKELRKRGIESDLLISKQIISGPNASINDPRSHDSEIESYPEWVHFAPINSRTKIFEITKIMKKYDIIHAYNATPIHAMFSKIPYIAQSGGDDLRIKAFERSITGYLLKRSYKKANQFVYVWPIHKPLVDKLKIKNAIYLPRVWEPQNFKKNGNDFPEQKKLTIFLPTAEIWETKGNDKFLQAFVKLCKEKNNIKLFFVDWGPDSQKAKKFLDNPNVKDKVEIIQGPISREKMSEYMGRSDLLVDQFNSGSFTRMAIEAFKFGIPILINIDEEIHKELHGESPPVVNAKTSDEIYNELRELSNSKDKLQRIANDAKIWYEKHYQLEKTILKYIEIYKTILK
jgi:glycosyltransferase involved in cell wall biosynthesis